MTVTLSTLLFHRALATALPFASEDPTIPMICSVHVQFTETHMIASATDRYAVGQYRSELITPDPLFVWHAVLSAETVRDIMRIFRPRKGDVSSQVNIESGTGAIEIADTTGAVGGRFPTLDVAYPPIEQFWFQGEIEATSVVGINGRYMNRFGRLSFGAKEPMRIEMHGPRKPIHVHIGENFRGLIMPVKNVEELVRWTTN